MTVCPACGYEKCICFLDFKGEPMKNVLNFPRINEPQLKVLLDVKFRMDDMEKMTEKDIRFLYDGSNLLIVRKELVERAAEIVSEIEAIDGMLVKESHKDSPVPV